MNLIGKVIKHKMLGTGTVTAQDGDYITIEFPKKTSRFQYTEMNFKNFLTVKDSETQDSVLKEFADAKAAAEAQRTAEEAARLRAAEEQAARVAAPKAAVQVSMTTRKPLVRQERISGKSITFYVFQGSTFDRESRGGYIWAPIRNKTGNTLHHWDRLLDVRPGDIILHGYNAHVQAVSIARGECYKCNQPEELRTEDSWEQEGRRVDCEYIVFEAPVKTSEFVDDILRLCSTKYAPFDKDGNGNMGYLYEINRDLARIFLRAAVARNRILKDIDYIVELLAEE